MPVILCATRQASTAKQTAAKYDLDEVEQQQIMAMHALSSGATPVTTSSVTAETKTAKTPLSSHKPKIQAEDEDELILTKDDFEDEEIDLAPWMLSNAKN